MLQKWYEKLQNYLNQIPQVSKFGYNCFTRKETHLRACVWVCTHAHTRVHACIESFTDPLENTLDTSFTSKYVSVYLLRTNICFYMNIVFLIKYE